MRKSIVFLAIVLFVAGLFVIVSCHGGHKSYLFVTAPELVRFVSLLSPGLGTDPGSGGTDHVYVPMSTTGTVYEIEGYAFIVHKQGHQRGQRTIFRLEGSFTGSPAGEAIPPWRTRP